MAKTGPKCYRLAMAKKMMPGRDLLPSLAAEDDAEISVKQARFLQAVLTSGGIATQKDILAAVETDVSTLCAWRKSPSFSKLEKAAYRNAVSETIPDAVKALKRLIRADLDHGAKGLATTERAVFRLLEGFGIFNKPTGTPGVALQAVLHVENAEAKPLDVSVNANLPDSLDADWS